MENLFDNKIEQLLIDKYFSKLTSTEKEKVLELYTQSEYDEIHNYIKNIRLINKTETQNLSISSSNKEQLNNLFKKQHQKSFAFPITIPYLKISVPYFKPLLISSSILLFIIGLNWFIPSEEYNLSIEEFNKYTTIDANYLESKIELDETTDYLMNTPF